MSSGRRDAVKERFWREKLARYSSSGLSVRQFCLQESLREPTFYAWRRELARRGEQSSDSSVTPAFVPVVVRDIASNVSNSESHSLVLELSHGRRLNMPMSMPIEAIARLLQALDTTSMPEGAR